MVKNTMNLVRKAKFVIDTKYDIYSRNVDDIYRESDSTFDMILNGFNFGYMQGMKAARAEIKKCGACHEQKRETKEKLTHITEKFGKLYIQNMKYR